MNDDEGAIVSTYLLDKGKSEIERAGVAKVDFVAHLFYELLIELGETEKADQLNEFYLEN